MKEKKIFDAITDVNDELLKEARETKLQKKKEMVIWNKWITAAASLLLIFAVGILLTRSRDSSATGPILDVIYPKAYAFEDYDAQGEIWAENPVDEGFVSAISDFSYTTGSLILKDAGKNTNYSPLSLYYALAIAATGADNETETELLNLLSVADRKELAEQSGNLYRLLHKDNQIGKLKIANSIWLDDNMNGEEIKFKEDFVAGAVKNFYASSHSVDFSDGRTGEAMAQWIARNTNGTLSPTIKTDSEEILAILNAIYFYDEWVERFDQDETKEDTFYLANGREIQVDFMNKSFGFTGFIKGAGFTRSSLHLKNGGQMVFILPDEGVSPEGLVESPEKMKQAFEGGEGFTGNVVWQIPKFSFSSEFELVALLKSLGLQSAFTRDADFSGITDHLAFISNIRQETHIAIDEVGVEAAAFTQISYPGSAPPEGSAAMILNRPFIYGITADNGGLLFVGLCKNPTA